MCYYTPTPEGDFFTVRRNDVGTVQVQVQVQIQIQVQAPKKVLVLVLVLVLVPQPAVKVKQLLYKAILSHRQA